VNYLGNISPQTPNIRNTFHYYQEMTAEEELSRAIAPEGGPPIELYLSLIMDLV
jgi:hypothetical protein